MKKLFIGLTCLAALSATAQNREIAFKDGDWKSQLALAKKEHKVIFFDAYTSWCGPCKMMAKDVFTKDNVADMFNQTFLNVKFDMEKGEGPALKDKYGVSAFPTYLFINGDGEVIHKIVGSMSAPEFIEEANKALKPESTAFGLAKKFNSGDHSEATAIAYMEALDKAYEADKMGIAAKVYFDGLPKASLLEAHNWELVLKYLNNPAAQSFAYLFDNKTALEKKYGAEKVNMYFQRTMNMSVYSVKRAYEKKTDIKDAAEKAVAIRKILSSETAYSKPMLAQLDLIEFAAANKWDKYVSKVDAVWGDENFQGKPGFVISAANDVVTSAPAQYYKDALRWADQVERNNPNLFANIQLADLRKRALKKQGKTAEAEVMAAKAETLRKEAAQKGQMTPPMMKD
ncbi:MAG: thioredoxin fold domain-containing protein [Candidatus Pedobacter colombiensis]|uniref:Thioredoxin fold domain-containing protein n=1 Tax=Candidatus Pedobacter colombiensis TaxID=3121371 RepID=A0AAJ5WAA9_9SPHI|nr:thioredoxin fold domain-containing protein [Pedobacter sp.]WEK19930.1 MAG: thioredoxin fold domain-containing protein [Pedobacter sp.]